jgi:hypothetical protein
MSNINLTSTLNTPQSGTKTITVTSPGTTFYLYDNSILLATSVVSASTSGAWGLGNCVANSGSCGAGTESAVCSDSINGCAGNPPSPQDCTVQCGGACSVPVNHSKPCSMGSVNGKVTSGVSSWKWTCISNGDVSSQCTEYKKKPSYLEN